jgi:hypothetical protein
MSFKSDDAETDLPQAWRDLFEALTLLAKHQNNDINPFQCSHDALTVCADPADFTAEELARLDELGFLPQDEYETFISHRFGSC